MWTDIDSIIWQCRAAAAGMDIDWVEDDTIENIVRLLEAADVPEDVIADMMDAAVPGYAEWDPDAEDDEDE